MRRIEVARSARESLALTSRRHSRAHRYQQNGMIFENMEIIDQAFILSALNLLTLFLGSSATTFFSGSSTTLDASSFVDEDVEGGGSRSVTEEKGGLGRSSSAAGVGVEGIGEGARAGEGDGFEVEAFSSA